MKIIYKNAYDTQEFDLARFVASLQKYGTVDEKEVERAIQEKVACFTTPHVSVLVRVGTSLIQEDDGARAYYEDHAQTGEQSFERLRRITGYLVGSLERWNDGKQAEERERVKHNVEGVYTPVQKLQRERDKQDLVREQQNEYHK